jgi:hypothetical protein
MNWNVPLKVAEAVVEWFWQSCEVKGYVVHLLEKYAQSTDNDIDDTIVGIVRVALLKDCPEK